MISAGDSSLLLVSWSENSSSTTSATEPSPSNRLTSISLSSMFVTPNERWWDKTFCIRASLWAHTRCNACLTSSQIGFSIVYYLLIVILIWIVLPGVSSFFLCPKVLISNHLLHRTIKRINSQAQKLNYVWIVYEKINKYF